MLQKHRCMQNLNYTGLIIVKEKLPNEIKKGNRLVDLNINLPIEPTIPETPSSFANLKMKSNIK